MFFIFGGYVKSPKGKKKPQRYGFIPLRPLIVKNNFSLNGGMRIKLYYLQGRFIILLFLLPLCGSIPHLRIYAIKVPKTDLRDSQFIS